MNSWMAIVTLAVRERTKSVIFPYFRRGNAIGQPWHGEKTERFWLRIGQYYNQSIRVPKRRVTAKRAENRPTNLLSCWLRGKSSRSRVVSCCGYGGDDYHDHNDHHDFTSSSTSRRPPSTCYSHAPTLGDDSVLTDIVRITLARRDATRNVPRPGQSTRKHSRKLKIAPALRGPRRPTDRWDLHGVAARARVVRMYRAAGGYVSVQTNARYIYIYVIITPTPNARVDG